MLPPVPLYHAYLQQVALAVFKVVKLCLICDFFWGFSCCALGHGWKGPMKGGLSLHLFVRLIVCPYVFPELAHLFLLKLSVVLGTHIQLHVTAELF